MSEAKCTICQNVTFKNQIVTLQFKKSSTFAARFQKYKKNKVLEMRHIQRDSLLQSLQEVNICSSFTN